MSGIATFSPFIKATSNKDSLPRIVIGVVEGDIDYYLTVDMNGVSEWSRIEDITMDWRYNPATELWDDPNTTAQPFGDE